MQAQNITQLVQFMDQIMAEGSREGNAMGYFAGMYRLVTLTVKEATEAGKFQDNERMQALVVSFANRYLKAYTAYQAAEPLSRCWEVAFDLTASRNALILQHLFLGMNAHINLDLGLSAAQLCPGNEIESLKQDFLTINIILANLVNEVQNRLKTVSPLMHWADRLGGKWDEKLAGYSLVQARDRAWKLALQAAHLVDSEELDTLEILTDKKAARIARLISVPEGMRLKFWIKLISLWESRDSAKVTAALWQQGWQAIH
ncbi:MAG: DUF5995 family protein [Bacteroidota bacterium]